MMSPVVGWAWVGITLVLVAVATVVAVRRGIGKGPIAAGWVMLMVHPGVWVSFDAADGPQTRWQGGLLFSLMGVALVLWSFWRPSEARVNEEDA